ncbi:glycosyltransferase [Methylobacterium oxalidis]|uniref:glycosyltransferase n=1 Tax=Methylobacterium oxalidis TaxID=944322 RepID=UPI0033151E73
MRVAIVHYWLVGMRGGEKVIEALARMYPEADIFTHVVVPEAISEEIRSHRIRTSFIAKLPRASRHYKTYLPLMPLALEQLDLRGYDLILSSESGPAKGIVPPEGAVHVCYCHSPMRYIWNMYHDYRSSAGRLTRLAMPLMTHYLRTWDESSAARVDHFIANSSTVAARIRRYYRREASIIHPPVNVDAFAPVSDSELGDYHLMVGELVRYKRPDIAVKAFNAMRRPLVVIGGGEMLAEIRALAGPTVKVLGPQPFAQLQHHYARCRGLIFPGEEDFGIVPVEAMASGRPVVAYGRGGATETVVEGQTGTFFEVQNFDALIEAVERLDRLNLDPAKVAAHAQRFNGGRFETQMAGAIAAALKAAGVKSDPTVETKFDSAKSESPVPLAIRPRAAYV